MKRLLKNKKGMSLLEVMIAISVLGLLTIPVMMSFMNTQRYAKKIDKETEISTITRTVKQIVVDGLIKNDLLIDIGGSNIDMYNEDDDSDGGINDRFRDFIKYCKKHRSTELVESIELPIEEGELRTKNEKYSYKIAYKHNEYYNETQYPKVYNVLIKIIERSSGSVVNQIKIAVKIDDL